MSEAAIALGSNLGDRVQHLQAARDRLPVIAASRIYETAPVDCPPGSQAFLNCVVVVEWSESLPALHDLTRHIESTLGRPEMRERHAPRPIDLDLLTFGNEMVRTPDLIIPHPRLHLRRFVLEPFAEIRPALILPGFAFSLAEILASLVSSEPPLRLHSSQWNLP